MVTSLEWVSGVMQNTKQNMEGCHQSLRRPISVDPFDPEKVSVSG